MCMCVWMRACVRACVRACGCDVHACVCVTSYLIVSYRSTRRHRSFATMSPCCVVRLDKIQDALDQFYACLDMAKAQEDKPAELAINNAIEDIGKQMQGELFICMQCATFRRLFALMPSTNLSWRGSMLTSYNVFICLPNSYLCYRFLKGKLRQNY